MNIDDFSNLLPNTFGLNKIKDNVFKIETAAKYSNGQQITLVLEHTNGTWLLTDGKQTLKYMNEIYELKSEDVKMCIKNVLRIYGFSLQAATILCEIQNSNQFLEKLFDMIMCIGQLANMYAFFDKP